jgi:hypothetical protein
VEKAEVTGRSIRSRIAAHHAHDAILQPLRPRLRRQDLYDTLLPTVELLNRRQAHQVDAGFLADYVALCWLAWNGSTLGLTVTGTMVCDQLRACVEEAA